MVVPPWLKPIMSSGIPRLLNAAISSSTCGAVYASGVRVMKPRPHFGGSAPPPLNRLKRRTASIIVGPAKT